MISIIFKYIKFLIFTLLFGCTSEEKFPESLFWNQSEPKELPKLKVLVANKEPEWKSKVTILVGDTPKQSWHLLPFSLRRLCVEIPDLSERFILIYSKESDYFDLKSPHELAIYSNRSFQLAFNGGDSSWPVRIYLGKNWCSKYRGDKRGSN